MIAAKGYAVHKTSEALTPWNFERREVGAKDVLIDILYCGICHSDIHKVHGEWNNSLFPMVPGHEIVGRVSKVGASVSKFKVGDLAGVGCMVDSCGACPSCKSHLEQFCSDHTVFTYNSYELDNKTLTFGGYSNKIVVKESFVLKISNKLPLAATAPLLCAGITTYSPLKRFGIGKGHRFAVLGLGGLGHMAVKLAVKMGAHVTVLSTSLSKKNDAIRLGAHEFVNTNEQSETKKVKQTFDFILDTVSAPHDYDLYFSLLKNGGTHICVGAPPEPVSFNSFSLIIGNKVLTASSIGGIEETQEMLDYCAEYNITSDIELIPMSYLNEAYKRVLKSDVKYRFVLDVEKTL